MLLDDAAFRSASVARVATLHSKARLKVTWQLGGIEYAVEYWQVDGALLS